MPRFKSCLTSSVLVAALFLVLPNLVLADCKDAAWKRYGQGSGSGEATYSQSLFDKWDWACYPASDCPDPPAVVDPNKPVSKKIVEGGTLWGETGCTSGQACCGAIKGSALAAGSKASTALPPEKLVVPKLNVDIPGLVFSDQPYIEDNRLYVPLLAQYISAFFKYILGIGLVATAIMFVYSAFLYIYGATGLQVSDAKKKMTDALIGLVILLGSYVILANLNPNTLSLGAIKFSIVIRDVYMAKKIEDVADGLAGKKSDTKCDLSGKIRNFKQYEPPWGGLPFGSKPLCTADQKAEYGNSPGAICCMSYGASACGITSLADVLASYGEDVTPQSIGEIYIKNGHRACNFGGSSPQLALGDWQKAKGIDKYAIDTSVKTAEQVEDAVQKGYPVILLNGGCKACSAPGNCKVWESHWTVISGIKDADNFTTSDPGGPYTYMAKSELKKGGCMSQVVLVRPKDGSAVKGCN